MEEIKETEQNSRRTNRSDIMGKGSIWRLLFRFSGPTIVSMMVTSSYNLVDAIFVGRLGAEAIAALAVAFPLMMFFIAVSMGTGTGAASLISRRLGAEDRAGANHIAGVAITLAVLIGGALTLISLPNLTALLSLFGATESILPLAYDYMSILVIWEVVLFILMVLGNIVTAEGNPMVSSIAMIVSAVSNIILDPIFIFGLGPVPALGVSGAAIATVIGRGLGGLILIGYLLSKKTSYSFRRRDFIPTLKIIGEIYRVGAASIARMTAGSVMMIISNRVAVSFGVVALAVRGVLFRSSSFAFMPTFGLGQGMLPLVGYNFGARRRDRVGEVVIKASLASLIWGVLCFVLVMLIPVQIISIFNTEPEFLDAGAQALRIFSLAFFTIGIQMTLSFFFQGIGKGFPSLILASARQIIFLFPALLILPRFLGLTGLWVAYPVADGLSFILSIVWTSFEFRRLGIHFRLRYQNSPSESGTSDSGQE